MDATTSPRAPHLEPANLESVGAVVPTLPRLPWLGRWLGNLAEFRSDRLGLQLRAAALGPIARYHLGPIPVYLVSDAAIAQAVLVDEADAFMKSRGLSVLAKPLLGEGLLTSEDPTHRRARKLLSPAFTPRRIAGYGAVMADEAARTAARFRDGAVTDLAEEMMSMTLAIAGRALFDADVRGDARVVGEALTSAMQAMIDGLSSPLQLPYGWPLPRHLRLRRAVERLDAVVYRIIRERRASGGDRGDVLSTLLEARDDDGMPMTDREVRDETMTLILAGHETTANLLTWTFYELARHADVRARVEAEVDACLAGRVPTLDDLPRLSYTAMVLDEAMRLWPPAYIVGRQALRDVVLAGTPIRAGDTVLVSIYALHRRAAYYADPEAFLPERMSPEAKKARPKGAYIPFGAGPRVCIGNHFALVEALIALATLVQAVRFEPLSEAPAVPEPLVTLRPRGGLPVGVHRRVRLSAAPSEERPAGDRIGGPAR